MKSKLILFIKKFPEILVIPIGLMYYVWIRLTGLVIPCVFRKTTGFLCPGCGITRVCVRILKGDFYGAYKANSFIFITIPLIIAEIIYLEILKIKGKKIPFINNIFLVIYLVFLIIFGIGRNIAIIF